MCDAGRCNNSYRPCSACQARGLDSVVSAVSRRYMSYAARPAVRTQRSGSRGDDVRDLQALLTELGVYRGAIDGIYGSQTAAAVRSFQQRHGLTPDGVVGPNTRAALAAAARTDGSAPSAGSRSESRGPETRAEDVAPRSDPGLAALSAPRSTSGAAAPVPGLLAVPTLPQAGLPPQPLAGAFGVSGCDMRDALIASLYS